MRKGDLLICVLIVYIDVAMSTLISGVCSGTFG